MADFNGDTKVDITDDNFAPTSYNLANSVPKPAGFALLSLGLFLLGLNARRRTSAPRDDDDSLTRIIRELTQKLHITGYGSQSKNMLFRVR